MRRRPGGDALRRLANAIQCDHVRRRHLWLAELDDPPLLLFPREVNPRLYDATVTALRQRGLMPDVDHGASGVATVAMSRRQISRRPVAWLRRCRRGDRPLLD